MTTQFFKPRKSIALIISVALIISTMLSGCTWQVPTKQEEIPDLFEPEYELITVGEQLGFNAIDIKYYYTTLTDKQKQIYLNIYDTVDNMVKGDVLLAEGVTNDDLSKAIVAYYADNPQHFWITESMENCWTVTNNISVGVSKFLNEVFSFLPWIEKRTDYTEYTDAYCKMSYIFKDVQAKDEAEQQIKQKMFEALSGISPADSAFDKELYIHDWIADNCTYDEETYQKYIQDGTVDKETISAHTIYGALVEQTATCDGYARAMQLMLSQVGIEARFITNVNQNDDSDSLDQAHAWNIVFFDGQPYHVDLTWDDQDLWGIKDDSYMKIEGDSSGFEYIENRTEHKYFNVPESVISKDHYGFPPQYATATNYNYFTYKNLDMTELDDSFETGLIDELCRVSSFNRNFIEISLGEDTSTYEKNIDVLFNEHNGLFYDYLKLANYELGYDYFCENVVYYGVDYNFGIVYVYTIRN